MYIYIICVSVYILIHARLQLRQAARARAQQQATRAIPRAGRGSICDLRLYLRLAGGS